MIFYHAAVAGCLLVSVQGDSVLRIEPYGIEETEGRRRETNLLSKLNLFKPCFNCPKNPDLNKDDDRKEEKKVEEKKVEVPKVIVPELTWWDKSDDKDFQEYCLNSLKTEHKTRIGCQNGKPVLHYKGKNHTPF